MKRKTILFCCILIIIAFLISWTRPKKEKIVFFGDSITAGAIREKGYISVLGKLISENELQNKYELLGAGVSGNIVTDLFLRLEKDVLSKRPTIVVIYIGVNDVGYTPGCYTIDINSFISFYKLIIKELQAKKIRVVICTPAVIGEKKGGNEQDSALNVYADWVRKLAARNSCTLVDLRKAFVDYNLTYNANNKRSGILTGDGVHPNEKGEELIAYELFKVLVTENARDLRKGESALYK